jgi:hypothetical protein
MSVGPQLSQYVYAIGNVVNGSALLRGYGWAVDDGGTSNPGDLVGTLHYALLSSYVAAPGAAGQDVTQIMPFKDGNGQNKRFATRDDWKTWLLTQIQSGTSYTYHMGNVRRLNLGNASEAWSSVTQQDPPGLTPAAAMAQIHQGYVLSANEACISRDIDKNNYREVWYLKAAPTLSSTMRLGRAGSSAYGTNFNDAAAQAAVQDANGKGFTLRYLAKLQKYAAIPF